MSHYVNVKFLSLLLMLIFLKVNSIVTSIAKAVALFLPVIMNSGFLPDRESYNSMTGVNVYKAITELYPLPQQELFNSYGRGNSYLIQGKFDESLLEFNRCLDIDSTLSDVFLSRGIVNEKLLKWDDAVKDYKKAIDLNKNKLFYKEDPATFNNLANAETGLGDWNNALKDFTYSASLKSDFIAPKIGRALVLFQINRREESLAYFNSLSEQYPLFADAQIAKAIIKFDINNNNKIDDDMKKAWEIGLEQDSRYLDVDWVENIRRFPPALVEALKKFKAAL